MAISDLTGTTWVFNGTVYSTLEAQNQYYYINFTSNNLIHSYIFISEYDEVIVKYNYLNTEVKVYDSRAGGWQNEAYQTIYITGGTDVTNAYTIRWLEENATQIIPQQTLATILFSINNPPYALVPVNIVQKKSISSGSSITNLTGTTWLFNSEFEPSVYEDTFNINFTSNNTDYTVFRRSYSSGCTMYRLNSSDIPGTQVYYFSGQPIPSGATYGWQLEAYRTITITGGADATNSTLISWLQAEATFVSGDSFQPARLLPTIPPTTLISFTIGNTTYQAEDGMTWYEWVNSEYNSSSGITCSSTGDSVRAGSQFWVTMSADICYGNDTIVANYNYEIRNAGTTN